MRVILVSDTHLSPAAPEAEANWDAVLRYVGANAPDVVIHLGDLSLDGAHNAGDLHYGRRQLDRLPVPWHAVPGNHDIGDNPWPGTPGDFTVDAGRCQRWLDIVGADHWSLTVNGWTLLAINAQLAGSGLEAEAGQWSWLREQLSGISDSQRVALITHKPVTATDTELADSPAYRFLPRSARDRLWAPSTWAVLPDQVQPVLGTKRCGIVSLDLGSGTSPEPVLVEPDGIAQLTVGTDIPDPYHR